MTVRRLILVVLLAFATPVTGTGLSKVQPWTGGATPPLLLPDLGGEQQSLTDLRGKVVVINFWATWCGPCVEEMPSLERLARNLADEAFALVAVNFGESPKRIASFMKRNGLDLPVLVDADMSASKAWVKKGLPTTFVIGPAQTIRYQVLGDLEWDSPEIEQLIRELLPKS